MATWKDVEIRELLSVRADPGIVHRLRGTARDAVVYDLIARRLRERGITRTKMQIITKLKKLKKMYVSLADSNSRPGVDRVMGWTYFHMCDEVWGVSGTENPAAGKSRLGTSECHYELQEHPETPLCARPTTPVFRAETPAPFSEVDACSDPDNPEFGTNHDDGVTSEPACTIPTKKRKTTILSQVNSMISATMSKLKDMDTAMQAQEDARLKRLMDHEKDMQKSLIQEMLALHRTIGAENHQRQLELVDRIVSRVPPSSSQTGL